MDSSRNSKSWLDLVKEVDNYQHGSEPVWRFMLHAAWESDKLQPVCVGYMRSYVVERMPWTEVWVKDREKRVIYIEPDSLGKPNMPCNETEAIRNVLQKARDMNLFHVLKGWRDELYQVSRMVPQEVFIERAGSALFGIVTRGVHMTAFVGDPKKNPSIWVPKRSKTKQTYPGMYDNTVAGGLSETEKPLECLVRESAEEAGLDSAFVRENARACGTISYFHVHDQLASGESGLLHPEIQYVFDLELTKEIVPRVVDGEVEEFRQWSLEEVKTGMKKGLFKPNCALVLIDFMVRHGHITEENEPYLEDMIPRLHRSLTFHPQSP